MSSSKRIAIIDYKMGNMYSVNNACETLGLDPIITSDPEVLLKADAAILPGVGAFGEAVNNLNDLNLVQPIHDFIDSGRPFMGICLGFQLLFNESEEFGSHKGLGLFEGKVKKFSTDLKGMKVPQIGWNKVGFHPEMDNSSTPLSSVPNNSFMYFVHSYYVDKETSENVLTTTEYSGVEYCSSIIKKNIFGTQFHPEKSGVLGLEIYKNWSENFK